MIYAVNKRTKEHQLVPDTRVAKAYAGAETCGDWKLVQADADGWIEWSGGECPLPESDEVEVKFGDGVTHPNMNARDWLWSYKGLTDGLKIIAYRPILEPQAEQAKEWRGPEDGLPPVDIVCEREGDPGKWFAVIPKLYSNGKVCCLAESKDGKLDALAIFPADGKKFRPIRTDRERWIEVATLSMGAKRPKNASHLGLIYDAGLAKLPEQTK